MRVCDIEPAVQGSLQRSTELQAASVQRELVLWDEVEDHTAGEAVA